MSLSLEVFFQIKRKPIRKPKVIYKWTTVIKEQVIKEIQMTNRENAQS